MIPIERSGVQPTPQSIYNPSCYLKPLLRSKRTEEGTFRPNLRNQYSKVATWVIYRRTNRPQPRELNPSKARVLTYGKPLAWKEALNPEDKRSMPKAAELKMRAQAISSAPVSNATLIQNFKDWPAVSQELKNTISRLGENIARTQKLFNLFEKAETSGEITHETGILARKALETIHGSMPQSFTMPDASYGPNGQILFFWDMNEHHLELEIAPDCPGYFFYRNRTSGIVWDSDYEAGDTLTPRLIEKLKKFA